MMCTVHSCTLAHQQIHNITSELQLNETELAISISAMAQAGEMSVNKLHLIFCLLYPKPWIIH